MNSSPAGASLSNSEVTNLEQTGLWVLVAGKEYFIPYADYPAFTKATIAQIFNLQMPGPGQLHWPDLDIDIEVEALEAPGKFPLAYR